MLEFILKRTKTICSVLFTTALVCALLPGVTPSVKAAGTHTYNIDYGNIYIAQDGGNTANVTVSYYESLGAPSPTIVSIPAEDMINITQTDTSTAIDKGIDFFANITNPVNITLRGVNLAASFCGFELNSGVTVNVTLADATVNTFASGHNYPGIKVPAGATLNISGKGALNATGDAFGAGIGGEAHNPNAGTISINSGIVAAHGGSCAAGIGGGILGCGGTVSINGGTVTATGGPAGEYYINGAPDPTAIPAAAGIGFGGGYSDSEGTVTIFGGSVNATLSTISSVTNGSTPVYKTTIPGLPASADVTYSVNEGRSFSCRTNTDGKLYLWLPATGLEITIPITLADDTKYVAVGTVSNTLPSSFTTVSSPYPACGNGAFSVTPDTDAGYTAGLTAEGIPTMRVNSAHEGLTYFFVAIKAVQGHSGSEVCVFVQMRGTQQVAMMGLKGNFDTGGTMCGCFNVRPGDIIKVYIVDNLSNAAGTNPTIL